MIEVNVVAVDEDDKIMSSYVLEGIQELDVMKKFPRKMNGMYEILGDDRSLCDLYRLMLLRSPASEKYDVRVKESIVQRSLSEDNFMEGVLRWKRELRFNPRDVMSEYKFMTECQTIDNLRTFFEDNEGCNFGILFVKPYE